VSVKVIGIVAFSQATCDFLLVFHCNYLYITPLTRYYHLFPKVYRGHVTPNTLFQR